MSTDWKPIEECHQIEKVQYLVSGWDYGEPEANRWYALAVYSDGAWHDANEFHRLYPPTHFALLDLL